MSRNVRSAILLGVSMGVHGIAGVYFVVAWLPSAFGFLVPLGALAVSIAVQWPRWFDVGDQRRWPGRLGRRLAMLAGAALLAGIVRPVTPAPVWRLGRVYCRAGPWKGALAMTDRYSGYERLSFDYPEERILRITFDRPERYNALDAVGHREITYVWREIDADPEVDCVILTGRGRAFSAGGDFEMVEQIMADFETRANTWKEARDLVYNIIDCGKPTVSAINGPAVGAGLVAGLLCDVSIAGRAARITDGRRTSSVARSCSGRCGGTAAVRTTRRSNR
jgi:hypothetical protein